MKAQELKKKYFDFFVKKGHKILPNVSLVPENDRTALFISAGMHPLVLYLLGEPHPLGKRLVSNQRCLRTDDIDEVGDVFHHTFFEMLGNWSLGDYFKKEAIEWSFEFLTAKEWLGIDSTKLAVSVFAGDKDAPFDQESYDVWLKLGITPERVAKLPKKNNWWGPAGQTGPCGPDTEMFVWTGNGKTPKEFDPNDPDWFEVWNDVFMEYEKTEEGKFKPLKRKNVDTGMGVERTIAVLNGLDDDYQTELFKPIIQSIEELSGKKYEDGGNKKSMRIIADHLRAAVFLTADGVLPSNIDRGYVLRKLTRRATDNILLIGGMYEDIESLIEKIITQYVGEYPNLSADKSHIETTILEEQVKYKKIQDRARKMILKKHPLKITNGEIKDIVKISADEAFTLSSTFGLSLIQIKMLGYKFNEEEVGEKMKKHQEISRAGAEKKFAGGLADHSEIVTKYHTATHLLNAALRQVLGPHVFQKGSNITAERLRFDFPNPEKLTPEQIKAVEDLVNQKIKENLPVEMEMMTLEEAKKIGAMAVFGQKYGEEVKTYRVGSKEKPFSFEVCGGPHVDFTGKLGKFKIRKEEAVGSGTRRLYAVLE